MQISNMRRRIRIRRLPQSSSVLSAFCILNSELRTHDSRQPEEMFPRCAARGWPLAAQGSAHDARSSCRDGQEATPKLADGKSDLNGTWDHLGGSSSSETAVARWWLGVRRRLSAWRLRHAGGWSGRERRGASSRAAGGELPEVQPEFLAKVKDLSERQVDVDTALQCQPPGVPRIGPPAKIVQTAREVVFLYDDMKRIVLPNHPDDGATPIARICPRATSATRSAAMRAIPSSSRRSTSTKKRG